MKTKTRTQELDEDIHLLCDGEDFERAAEKILNETVNEETVRTDTELSIQRVKSLLMALLSIRYRHRRDNNQEYIRGIVNQLNWAPSDVRVMLYTDFEREKFEQSSPDSLFFAALYARLRVFA